MSEESPFPPNEVREFIEILVKKSGGNKRVKNDVTRELTSHFEEALAGCSKEDIHRRTSELIAQFGETNLLAQLIRRAKQRCQTPLERFSTAAIKVLAAALILALAAALIRGRFAERDFREGLSALEREGLISDYAQLKSPRSENTTYYSGPVEQSASAFLLSLNKEQTQPLDDVAGLLESLERERGNFSSALPRARESLAALQPLLTKGRMAAALLPTPMEQIVSLAHLKETPERSIGPELQAVDLMRAFLLEAWIRHSDGKAEEAIGSVETALMLEEHLRDFPQIVSQIFALNVETSAFRLLGWMEHTAASSDAAGTRILPHACRAEYERKALAQAIAAESMNGRRVFHTGVPIFGFSNPESFSHRATNWYLAHLYFSPLFRFISAPDELWYFKQYHDTARCLDGPYFAMAERRSKIVPPKHVPKSRIITRCIASVIGPSLALEQSVCEAHAALARTAIALEGYKRITGKYPEELSALPGQAQADFYTDPFTGQPLKYEVSGEGFALHSLGLEGVDSVDTSSRKRIVWGE